MLEQVGAALNTDLGKLVAAFFLTTLGGGLLTFLFQRLSWQRQAYLDMHRQRYQEGVELLQQLSSMVDKRFFRLQRLLWEIDDGNDPRKVEEREREYFVAVVEWNESLRSTHNRIRLLLGDPEASAFLDYGDDARVDDPHSLHYRFVHAHSAVMTAEKDPAAVPIAVDEVTRLNWSVSDYLQDLTTTFARRAASLELIARSGLPPSAFGRRLVPSR
jgi:hypothetical protein